MTAEVTLWNSVDDVPDDAVATGWNKKSTFDFVYFALGQEESVIPFPSNAVAAQIQARRELRRVSSGDWAWQETYRALFDTAMRTMEGCMSQELKKDGVVSAGTLDVAINFYKGVMLLLNNGNCVDVERNADDDLPVHNPVTHFLDHPVAEKPDPVGFEEVFSCLFAPLIERPGLVSLRKDLAERAKKRIRARKASMRLAIADASSVSAKMRELESAASGELPTADEMNVVLDNKPLHKKAKK